MSSHEVNTGHASPFPSDNPNRLPAVPTQQLGSAGVPATGISWGDVPPPEEGINIVSFLHALRRRWLVATAAGILVATFVAVLLWAFIPVKLTAVAYLRVRRHVDPILSSRQTTTISDQRYETFKRTQSELIKTSVVLTAALREEEINQLGILRREKNKLAWLADELIVGYAGDSEILKIALRGEDDKEIIMIVDAVKDAYLDVIVNAEREDKLKLFAILKQTYDDSQIDITAKTKILLELQKTMGASEDPSIMILQRILQQELVQLMADRTSIMRQYREVQSQTRLAHIADVGRDSIAIPGFRIELALRDDPRYQRAVEAVRMAEENYQMIAGTVKPGSPSLNRARSTVINSQNEVSRLKGELQPGVLERVKHEMGFGGGGESVLQLQYLNSQAEFFAEQLQKLEVDYSDVEERLSDVVGTSSEVETRQAELISLSASAKEMKTQMDAMNLNLKSPARVQRIPGGDASVPDESDWLLKMALVIGAWVVVLCVTVFGVTFWDYQGKRINTPNDFSKEGTMHVIGSLPAIRRGGAWPFGRLDQNTLEGVVNDSIDSVRTTLLCNGHKKAIKVIMVTSAAGQEGKTTVASQLAVSLARSGRNTLLVDADIRNPQQHLVFGLPPGRGLCELLRGETNLDSVIEATPMERLWLMSAGQCDGVSVQAMATDSLKEVFADAGSRFDFVVVDCGPVLPNAEALLLGQHADTTVLSVRRDISQMPKISLALDRLRSVGIDVMGVVVNGVGVELRRTAVSQLAYQVPEPAETA